MFDHIILHYIIQMHKGVPLMLENHSAISTEQNSEFLAVRLLQRDKNRQKRCAQVSVH